jgi:hypothetical protein
MNSIARLTDGVEETAMFPPVAVVNDASGISVSTSPSYMPAAAIVLMVDVPVTWWTRFVGTMVAPEDSAEPVPGDRVKIGSTAVFTESV